MAKKSNKAGSENSNPSSGVGRTIIRYSLSCPGVSEKGIRYAIKMAATTYINSHNIVGKVSDSDFASEDFQAYIDLYELPASNTFAEALRSHILNSGKLPSNSTLRPKDIVIRPVYLDEIVEIQSESPDAVAFQRTIADIEARFNAQLREYEEVIARDSEPYKAQINELDQALAEREKTIDSMNVVLTERTKTVGELQTAKERQVKRIEALEAKIKSAEPRTYCSVSEALIQSYLKNGCPVLSAVTADVREAIRTNSLELITANVAMPIQTYVQFFNAKYGSSFKDETEIVELQDKHQKYVSGIELPEVKSLKAQLNQINVDAEGVEALKKLGVSPELVQTLESKVKESEPKRLVLSTSIEELVRQFDETAKLVPQISSSRVEFEQFSRIAKNIQARIDSKTQLPVLFESYESGFRIYLPMAVGKKGEFESKLYEALTKPFLAVPDVKTNISESSNSVVIDVVFEKAKDNLYDLAESVGKSLKTNSFLQAFGISPKITFFSEEI